MTTTYRTTNEQPALVLLDMSGHILPGGKTALSAITGVPERDCLIINVHMDLDLSGNIREQVEYYLTQACLHPTLKGRRNLLLMLPGHPVAAYWAGLILRGRGFEHVDIIIKTQVTDEFDIRRWTLSRLEPDDDLPIHFNVDEDGYVWYRCNGVRWYLGEAGWFAVTDNELHDDEASLLLNLGGHTLPEKIDQMDAERNLAQHAEGWRYPQ